MSAPSGSGPGAKAARQLQSWGLQTELADELEAALTLSQALPSRSSAQSCLPASSDMAESYWADLILRK